MNAGKYDGMGGSNGWSRGGGERKGYGEDSERAGQNHQRTW